MAWTCRTQYAPGVEYRARIYSGIALAYSCIKEIYIALKVNETMFSIPKNAFCDFSCSSPFAAVARAPAGNMGDIEGGTRACPIIISHVAENRFDNLMRVIYPLCVLSFPDPNVIDAAFSMLVLELYNQAPSMSGSAYSVWQTCGATFMYIFVSTCHRVPTRMASGSTTDNCHIEAYDHGRSCSQTTTWTPAQCSSLDA
jgi:hypothetical protein